MDDAMKDLGRRAIAAGWRWMPGARTTSGQRVVCVRPDEPPIACYEDNGYSVRLAGGQVPDLSDPATLGCLLAQVRERWGKPMACTSAHHGDYDIEWFVADPASFDDLSGARACPTESAALVAALEAAPKVAG